MSVVPTVFIVDDDPRVRDSLAQLVDSMDLKSECSSSAEEFLNQPDLDRPGCIVLDVCLPGLSGLKLYENLAGSGLRVPAIIISGHADVPIAVRAMKLGAFDFLEKPYFPKQLVALIRRAVEADAMRRTTEDKLTSEERRLATLTTEERTILDGIGAGKTNQAIADELDISLRTIQFRRSAICKKLHLNSKPELVRAAAALNARRYAT